MKAIGRWIAHCRSDHEHCTKRELAAAFPEKAAILLIDVKRMCLVRSTTSSRYLALSYVWGQVPTFKTTISDLPRLLSSRSLLLSPAGKLPRVVRDAINLTSRLDEQFLWIDALCIIQDDASVKHQQITLMAEIYNCATATIIACGGENADSPLLRRARQNPLSLWSPPSRPQFSTKLSAELSVQYRNVAGVKDTGIRRPVDTKPFLNTIDNSRYNQRGWTYQERLLSHRRIYFLGNQVLFQCRQDFFSEDGAEEVKSANAGFQIERFRFDAADDISPAYHIERERLRRHHAEWPIGMTKTSWRIGFDFWSATVQEYSKKQFSFDSDILDACTGIFAALEGYSGWSFLHGIPEVLIDIALLWTPYGTLERRDFNNLSDGQNVSKFPSWSWIGWKGPVTWKLFLDLRVNNNFNSHVERFEIQSSSGTTRLQSRCCESITGMHHDRCVNSTKKSNLKQDASGLKRKREPIEEYGLSPPRTSEPGIEVAPIAADESKAEPNVPTTLLKGILLKFTAFTSPAAPFLNRPPTIDAFEYCLPLRYSSRTVGVIYGVARSEDILTRQFENLTLILLSESSPAYAHFPYNIPDNLLRNAPNGSRDARTTKHMKSVLNVMLVKNAVGHMERLGVGQITKEAWAWAKPIQNEVVLG